MMPEPASSTRETTCRNFTSVLNIPQKQMVGAKHSEDSGLQEQKKGINTCKGTRSPYFVGPHSLKCYGAGNYNNFDFLPPFEPTN